MSKDAKKETPSIIKVTTAALVKTLEALLQTGSLVPCVLGPAGIGKSSIMAQISDRMFDGNMLDIRLGQLQEEDLTGIPSVIDGETHYNLPFFWPKEGKGLMFFDEVNRAKPGMHQCLFQLILDRKYFNYTLPEGWMQAYAGNWSPGDTMYNVEELDPALKSRMCIIYYVGPTYAEWKKWGLQNGIANEIIQFLNVHNNLLVTEPVDERPSPNPRTWEKCSDVIKVTNDPEVRRIAFSGFIGLEPTVMLLDFISKEYSALPDPSDIHKAKKFVLEQVSKCQNDTVTSFLNSMVDHIASGGGYEHKDLLGFLRDIPKEFAFTVANAIYTREDCREYFNAFRKDHEEELVSILQRETVNA